MVIAAIDKLLRRLLCLGSSNYSFLIPCGFSYAFAAFSYAFATLVMPLRPKSQCVVNRISCCGQRVVSTKNTFCSVGQIICVTCKIRQAYSASLTMRRGAHDGVCPRELIINSVSIHWYLQPNHLF